MYSGNIDQTSMKCAHLMRLWFAGMYSANIYSGDLAVFFLSRGKKTVGFFVGAICHSVLVWVHLSVFLCVCVRERERRVFV